MSARGAIAAKAAFDFKTWIMGLAHAKGIKHGNDLSAALYGRDSRGKPRSSGKVSMFLQGKHNPREETFARFASVLDVPTDEVRRRFKAVHAAINAAPEQPALALVREAAPPTPPPPRAAPLDQFSLVIDHGGTATLRLNLVGVPVGAALQAMAALTGAGLLKTGADKDE